MRTHTFVLLALILGLDLSTSHGVVPKEAKVATQVSALYARSPGQHLKVWFDVYGASQTKVATVRLSVTGQGSVELLEQGRETLVLTTTRYHRAGQVPMDSEALAQAPAWVQILAGRELSQLLRELGVSATEQCLALASDDTICVVLGARRGRDTPQVHVARATGRVRRVLSEDATGQLNDVILRGRFDGSPELSYLPAEIVLKSDPHSVQVLRTTKAVINLMPLVSPPSPPAKISTPL